MPYNINNQPVEINEEPLNRNGRHYVPLREVAQRLGGQVVWEQAGRAAKATIGQWTASVQDGEQTVDVNGQKVQLSAPPIIDSDRMYVPWDFFRDAYGYKASMEGDTLHIHL